MSIDSEQLRTVANVVAVALLIAVVVPFVVYGFPQVVGADHGFVVLSGSMEPTMSPGDAIIVREAAPGEIAEREVITFRTNSDTPTTHRVTDVIERDGQVAYSTKGDANDNADAGTVPHEQVVGEVMFVIPLLGYVVRFINTTVGFTALVIAPVLLFTLSELRVLVRSLRGETDSTSATSGDDERHDTGEPSAEDSDEPIADDTDEPSAEPADPGTATTESSDASFTLTTSSLQLLAVIFTLYLPYSAYVAYTTVEAWSIAAAVATGTALLFVCGLYAANASGDPTDRVENEKATATDRPSATRGIEADGGERIETSERDADANRAVCAKAESPDDEVSTDA